MALLGKAKVKEMEKTLRDLSLKKIQKNKVTDNDQNQKKKGGNM